MTSKRLLVPCFLLGLLALVCWPAARSQEREDRDRRPRREQFGPRGPMPGGGGQVLMKFDGDHIYVLAHQTLYKISKKEMKVEGKVSLRPEPPHRDERRGDREEKQDRKPK